jgi:hydroxymethylpyrimidine pyrophosphatase-like HAD family hydrolase
MHTDIRLIALDIDGCLIGPDEQLGFSVLETLKQAALDTPIALCTGRSGAYANHFLQMLGSSTIPSIVENGCFLYDPSGAPLSHPQLPEDLSLFKDIRDLIRSELPEASIEPGKEICLAPSFERHAY